MNEQINKALNEQINAELYSAYMYLGMATHLDAESLPGFAHWMKLQAREEVEHALRLMDHIADRGGRVELAAIEQPPSQYGTPQDVFEKSLAHEQEVTRLIHQLYALAVEQKDYPAQIMLQWFIDEQVEEEKTAGEILDTLRRIGDRGHVLVSFDRQLGSRQAG